MAAHDRRLWLAGAAGTAVGLGLGVWRWRSDAQGAAAGTPAPSTQADPMWAMQFDQPGGGKLAMQSLRGRPLLINFWATWCAPCVKELPELQRFQDSFQAGGWRVLALALDREDAVREFLAKMPLTLAVALGGMDGIDLGRSLGNDRGGLPFSVLLDAQGRVAHRKTGQTHFDELAAWARAMPA